MSKDSAWVKGQSAGRSVVSVCAELEPSLRRHVLLRLGDVADGLEVRCPFDSEAREFFKSLVEVLDEASRVERQRANA